MRSSRIVLGLWLAGCAIAALIATRTHYVADLSAFLPSAPTPEQAVLLDQLKSGAASRLILAGIEGGDAASRAETSRRLADALRPSGQFASVDNGDRAPYREAGRFVFEHRYALSPAVNAERFSVDGLRSAIDDTLSLLGTPAGALVKPILYRDPTGETVQIAEALTPTHAPRSDDGVWVSRVAPRAVLVMTTKADGADLDGQARALATVRATFAEITSGATSALSPEAATSAATTGSVAPVAASASTAPTTSSASAAASVPAGAAGGTPSLRLVLAGAGSFGVAARDRIKSEVERLATLGMLLMIGLLWLAFSSLRALAIAVLPVATGVLAGIAAVSLGFGQVHGMTLGFGTTLIGEGVDYAIYYLVQTRASSRADGDASRNWLRQSWPTVRIGLFTSIAGFAALVFAGFPGLAQLGVFSIAGLVAAATTTRFVFPVIAPNGAPGAGLRRLLGRLMGRAAELLPRGRHVFVGVAILAAVVLAVMPSPWHGELSDLSPIDANALKLDAALRADVGAADAGTLVAISGRDAATALAGAEAVDARLDPLVASGVLAGYDSPARFLPSPQTQRARLAALPDPSTLAARLAIATEGGALPAARLQPFVDDVSTARRAKPFDRADLGSTSLGVAVDALLLPGSKERPWRALVNLQPPDGRSLDVARIRSAIAGVPGAQIVAVKPELDAIYARYLHQATWQAGLGGLAVVLLLAVYLRSPRRLVRVLQPLAAATLVVLAVLAASHASLGILHLIGLLLTVAIGSNYALFFDHLAQRCTADADTLASLLLANLTTVVSFGLLATSRIPVLQAVGEVVAPGALLCLVFSAAFIARPGRAQSRAKIGAP